jgi:hypothetical protein
MTLICKILLLQPANYYLLLVLFTFIDENIIHIMELSLQISLCNNRNTVHVFPYI